MATQYLIGEDGAKLPNGIVLAHTLYGEPANSVVNAYAAPHGAVAVIPVGEDGIAYQDPNDLPFGVAEPVPVASPEPEEEPDEDDDEDDEDEDPEELIAQAPAERPAHRSKRCMGNNDTCNAYRMGGSTLCSAHSGRLHGKVAH